MDMTLPNGAATVVALSDGTTSLYTSTGGGVVGAGARASVVQASRQLLLAIEAHLHEFETLSQPPELPPDGHVNLTALTYGGLRGTAAPSDDLVHQRHPAFPVFFAAQGVITELRLTAPP